MSVKIRVSYTDDEELAGVIRLLSPVVKSWKVAKKHEGAYRHAYIYCTLLAEQTKKGKSAAAGSVESRKRNAKASVTVRNVT